MCSHAPPSDCQWSQLKAQFPAIEALSMPGTCGTSIPADSACSTECKPGYRPSRECPANRFGVRTGVNLNCNKQGLWENLLSEYFGCKCLPGEPYLKRVVRHKPWIAECVHRLHHHHVLGCHNGEVMWWEQVGAHSVHDPLP